MLTEIINLRSLVPSKARLNAALRRQHSRVANNQSEALPSQSPALPFSHGFPNSLETVFLTQTDYFLIAVTGEQSRSLPTRRLLGTDLSHLLNNRELDAIFARRSQPNVPGSRAGHTGDRGRVLTAFERQVLGARVQETSVPNRAIRYLAGPHLCEQGQRYLAAKLHRR
jgi:hypothetical protein